MGSELLVLAGAGLVAAWGVAHIVPVKPVVDGFGEISADNRRIVTMGWVAEGLTLLFIGVLCTLLALLGEPGPTRTLAIRACAAMLVVLAGWTAATGARTPVIAMKLCPLVKLTAAVLLLAGSA